MNSHFPPPSKGEGGGGGEKVFSPSPYSPPTKGGEFLSFFLKG